MKKLSAFLFLITGLFLSHSMLKAQGFEIKLKINGLSDTIVILGHYVNKSMYPDDTVKLDQDGSGVFRNSEKLPGGMYVLYLPSTRFFQILIDSDQHFSLETDTADFVGTLKIKGSDDNMIFYEFERFMKTLSEKAVEIQDKIKASNSDSEKENLGDELKKLGDKRIDYIKRIVENNPGLFVSTFLKATLDINVPDPPVLPDGKKDSTWQYYYYRDHYFDNFDYTDPRLLRTPLIEDKVMGFVTKVVPQIPDSIIVYVDKLLDRSKADSNVFRFMLITIFNHYAKSNIMGMDAVYVNLADKYYINDSWWSDKKFISDLKERIEKTRPLLIGKTAPDMELMLVPSEHFKQAENDTTLKRFPHIGSKITLHNLEAKYLVLVFWEADCGHCKTAIPKLYEIYENELKNKDIKILAVSTLFGEEGKTKWVDFVNQHKLYDWMNAWNPYSYQYKLDYDILSTPQFFILDKNKRIIAKRIGPEQIAPLIDAYENMDKQEQEKE